MQTIPSILFTLSLLLLASCGGNGKAVPGDDQGTGPGAAMAELEREILASPRNANLFAERALLNEQRDSLHLAVNDWNRAISLDSMNSDLHLGIGDLYFRKVRLEEAEYHLRKAAALASKDPEPRLKLAEILLLKREYTDAMGWANDALRLDQQHAQGYFLKGWIHMEAGDTALAISSYRTAIEQDPSMQEAFIQLGVLHAALRDPLALQYYNSALEIGPNSTETLYAMGMFAQENGMDSLALVCYARIKEISPEHVLAWYNTGYILLEHMGDPQGAKEQFTRTITLAPQFSEAWYNRGLAYEKQNMLDSAYADYRKALALQPDLTAAAYGVGRLRDKGVKIER